MLWLSASRVTSNTWCRRMPDDKAGNGEQTLINQIEPWIDDAELVELTRVIKSTFVTESEATGEFENLIRRLTGAKHAVAMTNGTAALFCVLKALGVGPGDEVVVPDMTFVATANAVILAGATPVFCDVRSDTYCLDIDRAEETITSRTKAVVPVHLYGLSAEMDELENLCQRRGLHLIEDAAQGVGVRYEGRHTGTIGRAGILSFYGNKTITTGEGGVVLTDDDELASSCFMLKNHGRRVKGVFVHESIGFNFGFTEMQAAVGIAQMHKLPRIIKRKNEIRNFYRSRLASVGDIAFQDVPRHTEPVFWFTNVYTDHVEQLAKHLRANGIGTRRYFYPLHKQPCYEHMRAMPCTVSAEGYDRGLSLPSGVTLTDSDLGRVVEAIREYFGGGAHVEGDPK